MSKEVTVFEKIDIIHSFGIDLRTKTIYVAGEIDGVANLSLRMKIDVIKEYYASNNEEVKEINMVISSPGGDATSITAMMDLYESYAKEGILINVYAEGICYSAATFFLACASGKRTVSKRTRFLIHELQISGVGGTHTQTKSSQKELEVLNGDIVKAYTECSLRSKGKYTDKEYDKTYKGWEKRMQNETYLSATEAKDLGLVDEVV